VLSSGGVSKGEFDFVKGVLETLSSKRGGESFELSVAIRPAKPLSLAWVERDGGDRVAFFGLPGNPVSSMVSYQMIALPGLRRMAGFPDPLPKTVVAVSEEPFSRSPDGRMNLLRVRASVSDGGQIRVRSTGGQQSHQLFQSASANALCLVPDGDGVRPGDKVEIVLIGDLVEDRPPTT
jgi:molybdopterin biosynthesis enzyme